MPKRGLVCPEDLVAAALDLVERLGWSAVTARQLATHLGISTMPIYSAFGSMGQLRSQVLKKALAYLDEEQRTQRSGNEALDFAVGYVLFAMRRPMLFEFVQESVCLEVIDPSSAESTEALQTIPIHEHLIATSETEIKKGLPGIRGILKALSELEIPQEFAIRSWIFTHGLAELLAHGFLTMSETEIIGHLEAAGLAFYGFDRRIK